MTSRKDAMEQQAADALAALGNRTRLRVFKLLVRAGREGTNIGTLQKHLGVPPTTLAHHLTTLTQAGLINQERRGREVICTSNYTALNDLLAYVKAECCAGLDEADEAAA
jgi:ArsR family transcriptional regulator, arsenate/arsenite/antimonite-responsive transcriptional repressor